MGDSAYIKNVIALQPGGESLVDYALRTTNEVVRLQAEVERLRAVLQKLADGGCLWPDPFLSPCRTNGLQREHWCIGCLAGEALDDGARS